MMLDTIRDNIKYTNRPATKVKLCCDHVTNSKLEKVKSQKTIIDGRNAGTVLPVAPIQIKRERIVSSIVMQRIELEVAIAMAEFGR